MQSSLRTLLLLSVVTIAACGDRKTPQDASFDSAATVAVTPEPRNPHVMGFEVGHLVDAGGRVVGGTASRFGVTDSVYLSIQTQYAPVGANVSARIKFGNRTVDSLGAIAGTPDSTGIATLALHFGSTHARAIGTYDVEVFLNGKSQGLRSFRFGP